MDRLEEELVAVRAEVKQVLAELRGFRDLPLVLSPEQACRELRGISPSKLKQMVRDGEILRCKVGKTYGFPRDEIVRIASKFVGPNGGPPKPPRPSGPKANSRKSKSSSPAEMAARARALAKKIRRD